MSLQTFFAKIVAWGTAELKAGETELEKLYQQFEPAAVSFLKQVNHDFVAQWMPQALQIVTNTLAGGTALTTGTLLQAAQQLEEAALKTGQTVLTQDALTTVQAAAAHIQAAAANIVPPKTA